MAQEPSWASSLKRLVGQAIAIFVGVAAALAGQAWFEARADRVAEREYLESVLEAVATVESFVEQEMPGFEETRRVAVELAFLIARPMNASRADSVARLAPTLSSYLNGDWLEPAQALLAQEPLQVVQDAAVRSELTALRGGLTTLRTRLDTNAEFILSEWRTFSIDHFDFRGPEGFWSSEPEAPPVSRHGRDGVQIAESPEFENLIDLQIVQHRGVLNAFDRELDRIAEIRQVISGRLAAL